MDSQEATIVMNIRVLTKSICVRIMSIIVLVEPEFWVGKKRQTPDSKIIYSSRLSRHRVVATIMAKSTTQASEQPKQDRCNYATLQNTE